MAGGRLYVNVSLVPLYVPDERTGSQKTATGLEHGKYRINAFELVIVLTRMERFNALAVT